MEHKCTYQVERLTPIEQERFRRSGLPRHRFNAIYNPEGWLEPCDRKAKFKVTHSIGGYEHTEYLCATHKNHVVWKSGLCKLPVKVESIK